MRLRILEICTVRNWFIPQVGFLMRKLEIYAKYPIAYIQFFAQCLEPQEVQVLLKWWLGIPITTADSKCPLCSSALDPDCHHALTCRSGGDIIARHNKLRDCFANLCSKACLSPQLEKGPGLAISRPADVLVPNWSLSNPAAYDLKVIHPLN